MARPKEPLELRFWRHVERGDGCWLWTGNHNQKGYGQLRLGRTGGAISTHRFSWALHNGPIPNGLFVLHHCDNPSCVNPAHLYVGTQRDNVRDAINRGRWVSPQPRVTGTRQRRLTDDQVRQIRADERDPYLIAHLNKISVTTVYRIKARTRKQSVPD